MADENANETISVSLFRGRMTLPVGLIVGLASVLSALLGALGGAWIGLVTKDHELRIKLVEIGIGILRAEPKEGLAPARRWAIRLIGVNAGAPFSPEEEDALVNYKLGYDTGYDQGYYGGTDVAPNVTIQPSPSKK